MYQRQGMVSSFEVENSEKSPLISYKPNPHKKKSLTSKSNVCL